MGESAEAAATKPPAKTVYAGIGGKTTLLSFVPLKLTVKTGTTVNFINKAPSEPQTSRSGRRSTSKR